MTEKNETVEWLQHELDKAIDRATWAEGEAAVLRAALKGVLPWVADDGPELALAHKALTSTTAGADAVALRDDLRRTKADLIRAEAERDEWKVRAEKAEAEAAALREAHANPWTPKHIGSTGLYNVCRRKPDGSEATLGHGHYPEWIARDMARAANDELFTTLDAGKDFVPRAEVDEARAALAKSEAEAAAMRNEAMAHVKACCECCGSTDGLREALAAWKEATK